MQKETNKTNADMAKIMSLLQMSHANSQQEAKEKQEKEKQEKAEKEKRDKQEKEQYQKWVTHLSDNVARMNQNSVPQSIINMNASAPSLSKITTDSHQLIKITPPKPRAPKRTMKSQESAVTEDTETVPKYRKIYEDNSGVTAATTGVESQSDYDPHTGEESAQRRDHQTSFGQQCQRRLEEVAKRK